MKAATDSPRQLLRIIDQLAIFLENRPGALVAVCDALAEAAINIYGMTVSDTVDHAVVRLVVSDSRKAVSVLEAHGALVVEDEVLMLENDNRPGGLSSVARKNR
ncbi:MAG: ACT domain-containing protein [Chthoniobacterales bacterium]